MNRTRKIGNIGDVDTSGYVYYNSDTSAWSIVPDSSISGSGGVSQEYVDGSLNNIRAIYIPDPSLSSDFYWSVSNTLRVNASTAGSVVNPDLDYTEYQPFVGDSSFYYTSELLTQILTINTIGTNTVNFTYDVNDDVSTITIDNYGVATRIITFEKDIEENIIAVHVT